MGKFLKLALLIVGSYYCSASIVNHYIQEPAEQHSYLIYGVGILLLILINWLWEFIPTMLISFLLLYSMVYLILINKNIAVDSLNTDISLLLLTFFSFLL